MNSQKKETLPRSNIEASLKKQFPNLSKKEITELTKEVLFQKLGNTWFIFTEINEDIIYSSMPEGLDPRETNLELYEVIEEHLQKVAKHRPQLQLGA